MNIHFNIPLFRQGKRETEAIQKRRIAPRVARRIARNERQAFEFALARTKTFFQTHYPQWDQYLFDEHFIDSRAASLLAGSLKKGEELDAALLVEAWATQMLWDSAELRQRHSAQLLPAACRFVHRFQIEIAAIEKISGIIENKY